jgi:REP element-mobilizing transposase RayT
LKKENTKLEDLIDVIDDESMETDVLIQEMMVVRNALALFIEVAENNEEFVQFLLTAWKSFQIYKQNKPKLDT